MRNKHWTAALAACAVPERARHGLEVLASTAALPALEQAGVEQCRIMAALLSGSLVAGELLQAHPEWMGEALVPELLKYPRREQGLKQEVQTWLGPDLQAKNYAEAMRRIRLFKQREMIRIAARDLARLGNVIEITRDISNVADVCLNAVGQVCFRQLVDKYGTPHHLDAAGVWFKTPFCVLGLGKLGGQELNYSSDVDVIFVYGEEGSLFRDPPGKNAKPSSTITNHQFFTRLAEAFVNEVGRATTEGQLYRIDLRLRPEGKAGPLARSLESYENFYAQWGQTWERMMLIKARCVAGDAGLAHEFGETIQSFRYPRSLGARFLDEIAAMKSRIEDEVVKAGELERNVKLGTGGIREVEFTAQMQQILHAGKIPFLQGTQTLPTLEKLVQYKFLEEKEAQDLQAAYCFLRDVEHRLQMENNRQTHTLPADKPARQRMAALMGFKTLADFEKNLRLHMRRVREIYASQFHRDADMKAHGNRRSQAPNQREAPEGACLLPSAVEAPALPPKFEGMEDRWMQLLLQHSFCDPPKALKLMMEFIRGPGFIHVSARTEELARGVVEKFLALCPLKEPAGNIINLRSNTLSDPDRVLARLDSFISVYGSRATLYEMWTSNPSLFELIVLLFDRSEFLAETAIRTPDLVDELMLSGRLRRGKTAEQTLADLRHGRQDEDQKLWLRRYHEVEFMRIGLREILGLADFELNLVELTALADACLHYALEVVLATHKLKTAPFAIIGMGKLGGSELTYGSDLDIIFVTSAKNKIPAKLQGLAAEVMDMLSAQTAQGIVFRTDARLRPDGEKGLLVNTLPAYEEYYRKRAQLWEIQAVSRVRPIAGDAEIGRQFLSLAGRLANFKNPSLPLTAFTPEWKKEIVKMRRRIEKERTPAGKDALAIKTGVGGLMDAEFIAQAMCLENGFLEPGTLPALVRAKTHGAIAPAEAELLMDNYRKLRRIEGILRRWSYEGETELPDAPAPYYRVSVRCGFSTPDDFRNAVAGYRKALREVYNRVFAKALAQL